MGFYGRKLIRRLRDEHGVKFPSDVRIRPCRPGWSTRSAGGFTWTFESTENTRFNDVGSQHTVRECAMAKVIVIRSTEYRDTFIDVYEGNAL